MSSESQLPEDIALTPYSIDEIGTCILDNIEILNSVHCVRDVQYCWVVCRQGPERCLAGPFRILEPTPETGKDETVIECKEKVFFLVKSDDIYPVFLFELRPCICKQGEEYIESRELCAHLSWLL